MSSYLTATVPGTGGTIKESPEDFLVEEIPLYPPCGEGEHLYLLVEKEGVSTHDMLHRLAKALKVKEREIGYAGLKDAKARTRQTVSITGVKPEQVKALEFEDIRILDARFHGNKLRLGHLAGNRFTIRLRRVAP
ncbi:tRNA pseudouridine(13) synthase TruD, partial [Trichloromonas sp.]|uniref:tRNA pseudouridine(13) synthase TruD n=1 Tax=Trichloromonas sp. TaxID=3069249 RepID=UPI003D818B48